MTRQLQPLNLGEILDRTAELYRTNFPLFAGIAAIFAGLMLAVQMLHVGTLAVVKYPNVRPGQAWIVGVSVVISSLVTLLLAGVSVAANCRAVAWIHLGEPATVRAATGSVLPRLGRYLWLMTIAGFRAWAPLAAIYVALLGLIFAFLPRGFFTNPAVAQGTTAANPAQLMEVGIGFLILAPLFLGALIYGILMSLRYSLAIPASVIEDLPARRAIKSSIELSKGSRFRIFVLALLVYVVRLLLGTIIGIPIIFYTFKHVGHPLPLWLMAITQLGGFLTNTLIGPIYSTGLTLFYYDQRVRKEGFDLEWMMRSAGLTQPAELQPGQT